MGLNRRRLPGPAWWAVGAVPTEGPPWECDSSCLGPWVLGESDSVSPSAVSDSAAPWTVARQAPVYGILQTSTGVGCHALLQGIFLTQRSSPALSHRRLYRLSHQGTPG